MENNNCIFCRIIAGEIPSATVYEDDDFKAIMDISPANKGHVILLPKKHCATLFEIEDSMAAKVLPAAKKIAHALQAELNCEGMNLLQNNGEAAGQTVFHFHLHLIPRYQGDPVNMTWEHGKYEDGEAVALAASIASRL
ncbi:histidine triad (HIT) family protein [Anaerotaenia torta]|uniref:HIT family protein n=1 Tax=Anaerotaenia torta TaxID=433293 RepID=UPI003D1910A9